MKKLSLSRETLRSLEARELNEAQGGVDTQNTCVTCDTCRISICKKCDPPPPSFTDDCPQG